MKLPTTKILPNLKETRQKGWAGQRRIRYIKSVQNVVDSIILQMGEEHLFNNYYNKFGMGCSCDIKDGFICAFIISNDVKKNKNFDSNIIEWSPIITQDTCSMLCANNEDAEDAIDAELSTSST